MRTNGFIVQRALISVTDKTGIVDVAKTLLKLGTKTIISTGGTAKELRFNGVPVTEAADITGFPECLDGRVKTLHPKIHGAILAKKTAEHMAQMLENGILRIDAVFVNLYDFEGILGRPNLALEDAIEEIDIGGPALIRAAAKNWENTLVVCDPQDYAWVLNVLASRHGDLNRQERLRLAAKAFKRTHVYDGIISHYLGEEYQKMSEQTQGE